MKDKISVLIADDNFEFGDLLNKLISRYDDICVVGVARDGLQTIDMVNSLSPDIVILDIIMPNLDGIGVLEKISVMELKKKPQFVILSAIGQERSIQKAIELGVEYYIVKPFDIDVLVLRIRQIYQDKQKFQFSCIKNTYRHEIADEEQTEPVLELEVEVTKLMYEEGIPPNLSGYQYIREAIIQTVNNSKSFNPVTKVLYPEIACKYNTTPQKVERSIRNAIKIAWDRKNPHFISNFPAIVKKSKSRPTNSEFIAVMADRVRLLVNHNRSHKL